MKAAALSERIGYTWDDATRGGSGQSNIPALIMQPVYSLVVEPKAGSHGRTPGAAWQSCRCSAPDRNRKSFGKPSLLALAGTAYGTFARLLLAQRRLPEALDLLATMERREQKCEHFGRLVPIYTLQAIAHHMLGQGQPALACLTQAVELAAPEDERRVFLDAGQPLLDLLPLVRQVAPTFVDQILSDAGIQSANPPQPLAEPLSMREVEIVRLIATGLSNEEVANQLVIAPGTVKKHLDHIYGKLGVHRRAQAAARARALGLV